MGVTNLIDYKLKKRQVGVKPTFYKIGLFDPLTIKLLKCNCSTSFNIVVCENTILQQYLECPSFIFLYSKIKSSIVN